MTRIRMFVIALAGLVAAAPVHAQIEPPLHVNPALGDCSIQFAPELTQDAYHKFVREFGSVSAYKTMASPLTVGRHGVAVGLERSSFTVEQHTNAWNDTFAHPDAAHELGAEHTFPRIRVRWGANDRLDLGAFYTRNPNANYGWAGVDAKYALYRQTAGAPVSVALRGAYTKTLYVHEMDMHAATADATAGRTLWGWLTPYAGLGADAVLARETSNAVDLATEKDVVPEAIAGFEARFWKVAVGAEAHAAAINSLELQLTALF